MQNTNESPFEEKEDSGTEIEIKSQTEYDIPKDERFIEINRKLTLREMADFKKSKYLPCVCGSGKKFKFCCYKKEAI